MVVRTLLLACVTAALLAGCMGGPSGGGETVTYKVGSDAAYPPFEDTVNGQIVGFDVDVLTEIGNRSGFKVAFQNSGFSNIIPAVQNGQFDIGASAFTINEERRQQVDFTAPYYENRLLVAVRATETGIATENDLRGKEVCTQEGTTSEFYLRDNLNHTNETLLLVPTAPQCADALKRGDVQALMIDAAFVRTVIDSSNGELKEAFPAIDADEEFGFLVKKGNAELLNKLNVGLASMKKDGTLEQLTEKWKV